jgi:hypothetical protein
MTVIMRIRLGESHCWVAELSQSTPTGRGQQENQEKN